MTLNIRGMIFSNISVSLQTISSATLSAKTKMRCNRSKRTEGIWSYLFRSFKTYKFKYHLCSQCASSKHEPQTCRWQDRRQPSRLDLTRSSQGLPVFTWENSP